MGFCFWCILAGLSRKSKIKKCPRCYNTNIIKVANHDSVYECLNCGRLFSLEEVING